MIEVSDLTFSYEGGEENALQNINLTIVPGEWLAIIGSNGSGKSTLARQLNGLLLPKSGRVLVDGLDTADEKCLRKIRERVAFVFQNPDNQLIATSVEDDIAFGPENLGLDPAEISRRVEQALTITGLTEKRYKPPHLLSGGEKQRVAIAGALAMASDYLILDEPTSMLDVRLRASVLATLEQLHRELGLGLIYVTNLMEEAALAERVIVLDQGRLVKEGTPREIFADSNWLEERNLAMPQLCQLAAQLADAGYAHLRGCLNQEELLQGLNSLHPVIDGECPEPLPDKFATKGEKQLWMDQVSYIYQQSSINACQALNDVDLCIKKGELTAIIGHGGSGKSTLATLAAGLYLPTSGHVFLNGEEAAKESVFRQAGLVFQYPEQQLFGETVFEEVAFGPKNFGVAESWLPIKVREALTDVGLLPELFWHRSPFTLSGGQKRRVCIAGILATDPQVMIFDEPSAGLDEGGRRWIMNLTTRLNQAGKTILWISHNMSEVAELADRLIVLAQGRIIADGTPCQVFAQADALKRAGLETPPIYQLCHNLRRLGWPLPENIITVTEAKDALLRILGGKGNV